MKLLAFDLETTGLDPHRDRIVELAFVRAADGLPVLHQRLNPGVPIPAEATAVHGIADADVAGAPRFAEVAAAVQAIVSDPEAVLVGYGCRRFDTLLLDAELRRAGEPGLDLEETREIDLLRVWVESEPRTLEAAVERFLGHGHEDAHRALADAATLPALLRALADRWGYEIADLLRLSRPAGEVDRSGRLRWDRERGEVVFAFGRHRGEPVRDHPDYVEWMLSADFPDDTLAALRRLR